MGTQFVKFEKKKKTLSKASSECSGKFPDWIQCSSLVQLHSSGYRPIRYTS